MSINPRERMRRRDMQSMIAFTLSICAHATLCLVAAFSLLSGHGSRTGSGTTIETIGAVAGDEEVELTELELSSDAIEAGGDPGAGDVSTSIDSLADSSNDASSQSILGIVGGGAASGSGLSSIAGGADFEKELSKTSKPGSATSFFGASAHGDRFVFVIDSSGSMRGPRWQALCKELLRAIQSLSPEQEFFIISFDSEAHPMFGKPPPKGVPMKPTRDNVARVRNWINSLQLGRQTFPSGAVGMALRLKPDAIFLLSDGEINDSTIVDLRVWNRMTDEQGYEKTITPIHTVLLHSEVGFMALQTIAQENEGTFVPVPAPPGLW